MKHPSARRVALPAAAALTAVALLAVPAAAHVTVSSPDAAREGYGKVVFRVPTESDTAATTKLVVTLPADTPLTFVTAQPKPGWDVEVEKGDLPEPVDVGGTEITEAVRTVTWSTDGDGIQPGEFDEFAISGGPFPDAEDVTFSAEQTYSDGEVVAWDQVAEGDAEPDKPAPVLTLLAASADGHGGSHAAGDAEATSAEASDDGSSLPTIASIAALVLSVVALALALRQDRRRA